MISNLTVWHLGKIDAVGGRNSVEIDLVLYVLMSREMAWENSVGSDSSRDIASLCQHLLGQLMSGGVRARFRVGFHAVKVPIFGGFSLGRPN